MPEALPQPATVLEAPSQPALCIALLGAESTGKTTLVTELAPRLAQDTGLRVAWVPEVLRQWCDEKGRTPRADEQEGILREQHARIDRAAVTHDVVVCDTTAIMTAVYHRIVFGDRSLDALAAQLHRRVDLTLLTALDLPWVPDGQQRDGPQVRLPVDDAIRELLSLHGLGWSLVSGSGPARLARTVDAVAPLLRRRTATAQGLFTRLSTAKEPAARPRALGTFCDCCSVPECERALLGR